MEFDFHDPDADKDNKSGSSGSDEIARLEQKDDDSELNYCSGNSGSNNSSQNSQAHAMTVSLDSLSSGSTRALDMSKSFKKYSASSIKSSAPESLSYLLTNLVDAINLAMMGHQSLSQAEVTNSFIGLGLAQASIMALAAPII